MGTESAVKTNVCCQRWPQEPPWFGGVCLAGILCLVPEQVICIQVQSADPNTVSPSLSSFPVLSPILRARFLVLFTFFFVFWFHHPWNQDSSEGNSIREALQQFISNSKGERRKLAHANNLLCYSSLLPAQVPFETQRSQHPLQPRAQPWVPNWVSLPPLCSGIPPDKYY